MSQETVIDGTTLIIKRTFKAPIEKVYRAWTDPVLLARWLRPNERWNEPVIDIDPKLGGRHNITMRHSDGDEFHQVGKYLEIVPNEKVSFTWTWLESPMGPQETLVTVALRTVPGGTELTLTHDRQVDPNERQSTATGWNGCLDSLGAYLADATA